MRRTLDEDGARLLTGLLRPRAGRAGLGEWVHRGRCAEVDPELWFPPRGASDQQAKAVCAGCEVRGQCLAYAMEADEEHGVWGGLNRAERVRLREAMKRDAAAAAPGAALPVLAMGLAVGGRGGGLLAGAPALAGPAPGELGVGGGQGGAVGVVAVLGDLGADVAQEVLGPVAAEPLADPVVGLPHRPGDAEVNAGRVVGHLRDALRGRVHSCSVTLLCGYTVTRYYASTRFMSGRRTGERPRHGIRLSRIYFHFFSLIRK